MYRRRFLLAVLILGLLMQCACNGNTGDSADPTAAVTSVVTPSPEGQPSVSPPTTAPTETPTPTPLPGIGSAEMMSINRELHEVLTVEPITGTAGTMPAMNETDRLNYEYGIIRFDPLTYETVDPQTGRTLLPEYGEVTSLHISGLKDTGVQDKINKRIDEIVTAFSDPSYLINVSGILGIMKEKGRPEIGVICSVKYDQYGILSVLIGTYRSWYEEKEFYEYDEIDAYIAERWPEEDGHFYAYWTVEDEDETTRLKKTKLEYGIRESYGLTFSLVTGEELRLSDIFPEGEDYLAHLNREVFENALYDYTFSDDYYRETGERRGPFNDDEPYDASKEYDGGALFAGIFGNENFYLYYGNNGIAEVYLPHAVSGREGYARLPVIPYSGATEDIYLRRETVTLYTIGHIETCEFDMDVASEDYKIGSVRVSPNGTDGITLNVYRGRFQPRWTSDPGRPSVDEIGRQLTDEVILKLAKQSAELEWRDGRYSGKSSDICNIIISGVEVYPSGYAVVSWQVRMLGEDSDLLYEWWESWIKDGEVIAPEELLDVSYEELLTEVFLGLTNETGKAVLPEIILRNLRSYESVNLGMSDPLTVLRHLKIYEGYPFPQIQ